MFCAVQAGGLGGGAGLCFTVDPCRVKLCHVLSFEFGARRTGCEIYVYVDEIIE